MFSLVPFINSQVKFCFALFPVTKVFSLTATNFRVCVSRLGKKNSRSLKPQQKIELQIAEVWEQALHSAGRVSSSPLMVCMCFVSLSMVQFDQHTVLQIKCGNGFMFYVFFYVYLK